MKIDWTLSYYLGSAIGYGKFVWIPIPPEMIPIYTIQFVVLEYNFPILFYYNKIIIKILKKKKN